MCWLAHVHVHSDYACFKLSGRHAQRKAPLQVLINLKEMTTTNIHLLAAKMSLMTTKQEQRKVIKMTTEKKG